MAVPEAKPTNLEIQQYYRKDVQRLSDSDLLRMVRGDFEPDTPPKFKRALTNLATDIAQKRGIKFPYFTALFSTPTTVQEDT